MPVMTEEYQRYVLDDLKKFNGLRKPVKAGMLECVGVKSQPPQMLHPNPDDEFSIPEIGPNYEIVSKYAEQFRQNESQGVDVMDEPLMVEKMSPEGYLLLNGHHRWMAALRVGLKKVPVKIINLVHEEDLKQMIQNAEHNKRAVFDLDEVLFVPEGEEEAADLEKAPMLPFQMVFRDRLRQYSPALLNGLNEMGYDIWVYTGGYHSVEYIDALFGLYDVKIHGIVNGARRGRKAPRKEKSEIEGAFLAQYRETLHIDTKHVLRICADENEFEYITLDAKDHNWAARVMQTVQTFQ